MQLSSPRDMQLLCGTTLARTITDKVTDDVASLKAQGVTPGLAVILVGDDPASSIYVRSKQRKTEAVGMRSVVHRLPADAAEATLLELIKRLNADPNVHGILVQLPLPAQIRRDVVLESIDPSKDVDGFHPVNVGRLAVGRNDGMIPCTPQGCMMLLHSVIPSLTGLHAVVIGCSNIVGRPMAQLLLNEGCTVVITHLQTRDVAAETRRADIIVVAAGHPGLVRAEWVKPGAVVIDVGINRVPVDGGYVVKGDVAFDEVFSSARAITPVPGGVGPMTIACLLQNTLHAAQKTLTKVTVS